jgi:hypothetical protein
MRTLLLLALSAPLAAQVIQAHGYHIVTTPPGETYATPAPAPAASSGHGSKGVRRPASHGKGAPGSGFKAPGMPAQIASKIRKH